MKIYFCDGCNESIPLGDIQAGQVTTIKGKLFCRKCIPLVSGAPAAAAPARHAGHPLLVATVVALVAWALWTSPWMAGLVGRGAEPTEEAGHDPAQVQRLAAVEQALGLLGARLEECERRVEFRQADMEALRLADADLTRSLDQLRMDAERLSRGQADMGELIEKIHLAENRAEVLESRLNVLADMVYGHERKLELGLVPATAAAAGESAAPAAPGVDPGRAAELESLRRRLLDPDPGQRFDAVHTVGYLRLKELAPELLAVLRDEDPFVRQQAMIVLGDFGHVEAVPALLEALDDPQLTLRRTAAETLVRLTGYDPGFDHKAGKAERGKAIARWREWITAHGTGSSG